jgi:hypothetical protein
VAAWSGFHAAVEQLEPFRCAGTVAGRAVAPTFLRHADEQTVAAVAALNQTMASGLLRDVDFRTWGVLGCIQCPGRAVAAWNFERFKTEGAWGVSPHIIPHRCLHSLSGTLSLALKCEGPNFGIGEPETLLPLALAWLAQGRVPGIWVALTAVDPERPPNPEVPTATPGTVVHALTLALVRETASAQLRLRLRHGPPGPDRSWDLSRLETWLLGHVAGDWHLTGGLAIERSGTLPRIPDGAHLCVAGLQEVRS